MKLHVIIILTHADITMLHININMVHVDKNTSHVDIICLACKVQKYDFFDDYFMQKNGSHNQITDMTYGFVCSIVVFRPTRECSLIWRRHHCRWRAADFDLWSALMAIEQWGFYSVPHLLWHGASVYKGYLRAPVTHLLLSFLQWSCHYLYLRLRDSTI